MAPGFGICRSCCAGEACGFADGELDGSAFPGTCVWGATVVAGSLGAEGIGIPGVCSVCPPAFGMGLGLADFRPADR